MVSERLFYKETVVRRCNGEVKTKPGIHRAKGNAIGRLYRPKTRNWCTEIRKTRHFSTTTREKGRRETLETSLPQPHPVYSQFAAEQVSTTNSNCVCALLL